MIDHIGNSVKPLGTLSKWFTGMQRRSQQCLYTRTMGGNTRCEPTPGCPQNLPAHSERRWKWTCVLRAVVRGSVGFGSRGRAGHRRWLERPLPCWILYEDEAATGLRREVRGSNRGTG